MSVPIPNRRLGARLAAAGGAAFVAWAMVSAPAHGAPPNDRGDADGDGMSNHAEYNFGTDPEKADSDSDGLSDPDEVHKYNSNPRNAHSDGDTLTDGTEVKE